MQGSRETPPASRDAREAAICRDSQIRLANATVTWLHSEVAHRDAVIARLRGELLAERAAIRER